MRIHLFRALVFICLLVAVALLPSLLRRRRRPGKMSPYHLQTSLSQEDAPLVLDVRNPDEFVGERGHITEALLCPLSELDNKLEELKARRTQLIVTV
jgi:3-mercaptopyruvate sulfurtransferase SseA